MSATFDVAQHHRDRTRRAEQRANMLEAELAKTIRLLGLAVQVAAGDEADPVTLLRVLEQLDAQPTRTEPTIDDLAQLLRETAP